MPQLTLEVATSEAEEIVDITRRVGAAIQELGVRDGLAHLFCAHTTAALMVQDNAVPEVRVALRRGLATLAAAGLQNDGGERVDAHLKAALLGPSVAIPVRNGLPALGAFQAIYLCEFSGPRTRKVLVHLLEG